MFTMQYIDDIRSFFQNSINDTIPVTPHSAPLHVGLKSSVPSGRLRNTKFASHTYSTTIICIR
ncbi:hypothetical protein Barb4_04508 [Bacteroidales bacterium Barb4]|nr:hypothetical protein Barb4_04508 [Bacteroidales bacterium Barb4]